MKRYEKKEKKRYLEEWESSNKSALAFCKEKNLSYPTFSNWRKKPKPIQSLQFIEVNQSLESKLLHEDQTESCSNIAIEKDKLKIIIPHNVNKTDLYIVLNLLGLLP